jgi:hypothetical protein
LLAGYRVKFPKMGRAAPSVLFQPTVLIVPLKKSYRLVPSTFVASHQETMSCSSIAELQENPAARHLQAEERAI